MQTKQPRFDVGEERERGAGAAGSSTPLSAYHSWGGS